MLKINFLISLCLLLSAAFVFAATTPEEATEDVKKLIEETEVYRKTSFCVAGKLDCRTHYYLKNKTTGQPVHAFYVTFVSADRQLGSSGYFIPIKDKAGWFYRYEDMVFDGKKVVTEVAPEVEIEISAEGVPTRIKNIKIMRLGSTRYSISDVLISDTEVEIIGVEKDSVDKNHSAPYSLLYKKVEL